MEPAENFASAPNNKPIYTELTEYLSAAFKVSLFAGIILSTPVIIYQAVMFASPGLNKKEKIYLWILIPSSLSLFLIGAAFGYWVLLPPMIKFLLTFGSDVASPFIKIGNYTNIMISLLFWMGLIFETPLIMFFLSKIGVVNYKILRRFRRHTVVLAFVLGAIITPTIDPITQSLVAVPIILMYEAGIWLSWLATRKTQS
jgi:sec-independent protein translocase protein TatC